MTHATSKTYAASLKLLFDEQTLSDSMNVISGKENFFGLHSPGLSLDGFETHKKLLDGYKKLHLAKQNNWKKYRRDGHQTC